MTTDEQPSHRTSERRVSGLFPNARERRDILHALRAGVVPVSGQRFIQVGRGAEVEAVLHDLERVAAGGAVTRLVLGDYGTGKSAFLALARETARQRGFVTMHADLGHGRRLHSTDGYARALLANLAGSAATRSGLGGLAAILERADAPGEDLGREHEGLPAALDLRPLMDIQGGLLFVSVVERYHEAKAAGDERLQHHCVRWMSADYRTITEARSDLNVRSIVQDRDFYDHLKLLAGLACINGHAGLLVTLDEAGTLSRLTSRSRETNYEQVLTILNDTLQGHAKGIGVVLAGTPDWVTNPRHGLYRDAALRSRLEENTLLPAGDDLTDSVIRLKPLTIEEHYLLLEKVAAIHAYPRAPLAGPDIEIFLRHHAARMGSAEFLTTRDTVRAFLHALKARDQRPDLPWAEVIIGRGALPKQHDGVNGNGRVVNPAEGDAPDQDDDDGLRGLVL